MSSRAPGPGLLLPPPGAEALSPSAALAEAAWQLEQVPFEERRHVLRGEAGLLIDGLLTRVARGQGALEVSLAEGLAALSAGDRLLRLGYSCVGDYARERLGLAGRTAQALVRLGAGLTERPVLRAAVRRGEVSLRRAQVVLPAARGEAEAAWVERARGETTRALEAAVAAWARGEREAAEEDEAATADGAAAGGQGAQVRAPPASPGFDDDEPWERLVLPLPPETADTLDRACALAGRLLGAASPTWQRLEAIAQEYLGEHPPDDADHEVAACGIEAWDPPPDGTDPEGSCPGDLSPWANGPRPGRPPSLSEPIPAWSADLEAVLEQEFHRWDFLATVEPVGSPPLRSLGLSPQDLDLELRHLSSLRARWDELLGHLALLLRSLGLWRDMGFLSFPHYLKERLGLGTRAVEQRIALERRLHELPPLRAALRAGRLSYEQARLVARVATDDLSTEAWVARAEGLSCLALQRLLDTSSSAQVRARGHLDLRVPRTVGVLLAAAFRAAERASGRWLSQPACLSALCDHFLLTWAGLPPPRRSVQRRVLHRDHGLCQVPGCSRAAAHAHHLTFRSRGGSDLPDNLVALCAAHHLHGVHAGWLRVHGSAPHHLSWELGERCPPGPDLGHRAPTGRDIGEHLPQGQEAQLLPVDSRP